jgi:hypothetical protein
MSKRRLNKQRKKLSWNVGQHEFERLVRKQVPFLGLVNPELGSLVSMTRKNLKPPSFFLISPPPTATHLPPPPYFVAAPSGWGLKLTFLAIVLLRVERSKLAVCRKVSDYYVA